MRASAQRLLMTQANELHLEKLCHLFPEEEEEITDMFWSVEKYISTQLPFIATLGVAVNKLRNGYSGFLGENLVCTPFTSCGTDGVRYRTKIMELLHEAFLTARMSELGMDSLREALQKHGMDIIFLCCCGTVLGEKEEIKAFRNSEEHRAWDYVRSRFSAQPTPLKYIRSLGDLEGMQMLDLSASGAEKGLFREIDRTINHLAKTETDSNMNPDSTMIEGMRLLKTRAQTT